MKDVAGEAFIRNPKHDVVGLNCMAAAVQPNVVTACHSTQEVVFGVDAKRMLALIA